MTEHLRAAGEGNLSPSDHQMGEDTNQQDADSHSGESSESRSTGPPAVEQAGEPVEVPPEQVDVEQKILKKLRAMMSTSYKDHLDADMLKECFIKVPIDLEKLLNFLQKMEDLHKKKADQGQKPSGWFWPWSTGECHVPQTSKKTVQSKPGVKSSSSQTVKVHSVTTGRTLGADDEILEKVKNMKWTQVKITDYQECDIIIVFCPITSRVGSDVPAAMRKIPAGNKPLPVILVLMHHTRDVDFSTDIKKWSGTYQNVVLDVHVLFHETLRGLLKCPRNDEAVKHIQTVLKAHSKIRGLQR